MMQKHEIQARGSDLDRLGHMVRALCLLGEVGKDYWVTARVPGCVFTAWALGQYRGNVLSLQPPTDGSPWLYLALSGLKLRIEAHENQERKDLVVAGVHHCISCASYMANDELPKEAQLRWLGITE